MSQEASNTKPDIPAADTPEQHDAARQVSESRRRLIKLGVTTAPIILTLASRPVLAWHCKSPSAWGSEQMNPATSHAPHDSYTNETWTIYDWKTNNSRNGLGKPWARFGFADGEFKSVTLLILQTMKSVPLTLPSGVDPAHSVYQGLSGKKPDGTTSPYIWSNFAKYLIVAQLNRHLLAAGVWDPQCVTQSELSAMATRTYPAGSTPWTEIQIITYLTNNWIARAS